jgi:16S rRNA (uracil1498-N3)-methyltransferase
LKSIHAQYSAILRKSFVWSGYNLNVLLPRFFAPDLQPATSTVTLAPDESAHLARVLRLGVGARVLLFDGRGHQHVGSVASIDKTSAVVNVLESFPAAPETRLPIVLAQAVLKGDKMEAVIRDATMMGVSVVRPVITQRTVVPRSAAEQPGVQTRWHRIAVASAKQCGRAVVPRIEAPATLELLIEDASIACRLMLVEPAALDAVAEVDAAGSGAAAGNAAARGRLDDVAPASALVLIGPEGGWTEEEVASARRAGFRPLSLGPRTLRAESAPLAALSVLSWVWNL